MMLLRDCLGLCLLLVLGFAHAGESEPAETSEPTVKSEQAEEDQPSLDERLDALLAETLSEDEYRESERCLSRHNYRSVDILNQEYLLFRKGSRYWLNKLRQRCVVLRRDLVLTFVQRGTSSICSGDLAYVSDRFDMDRGFSPSGRPLASQGTCVLGEFESISVEQAALLRELR